MWRWEKLPEGQPALQHSTRQKPLISERHVKACLEFAKRHLEDFQTVRYKILLSNEAKIELFGLDSKRHVWRKPAMATVKHGGGNIMPWGCFSVAETGQS